MKHSRFFTIAVCLLSFPLACAQDHGDGDLPQVGKLLSQASEHVATLEPSLDQAYLFRQLATLYARSHKLDAAYKSLDQIQIP
ncbi:MAG: hypothetical protein AAGG48_09395 [Planctomycetota bacterium]